MKQLNCKSYAKVNLCLHILGQREDGFHNIQSIFQTINLFDTLTFIVEDNSRIKLECDYVDLKNKNNIIIKTWDMLASKFNIKKGIHVSLKKNIPVGSGLGGGSSNAAVTLLAIDKLFNLQLSKDELLSVAETLGSDVPFFLDGGSAYVSGRGDIINKLSLEKRFFVLIFPEINISTSEIYRIRRHKNESKVDNIQELLLSDLNSLESVVMEKYPQLNDTKYWLSSLGKVKMSGTGSTLYIEFDSYESANEANKEIGMKYKSKMVSSLDSYDIFS
mgnify:CR=1 FL=1